MPTNVFHVDQNVIVVVLERGKNRKINKERLKIMLQISGCKPSHSHSLCDKIFEQIFSRLENSDVKEASKTSLNSVTVPEKYFKELVVAAVKDKKYIADTYNDDFEIAWSLSERKQSLIILLGGTSGTGKSTASSILASRFGISTVLSTDSIRHIMRNFYSKEDSPILFASTYEAGKYLQEPESRRVIKGYKAQCELVQQKLETVIQQFAEQNQSIIIEGVHLTPYFMIKIMKKFPRVLPLALCIIKESKHKERFAVRSKYMTLDSKNNKYIENFANIRLIQKWFLEKADENLIPKVDNVNIDKSIDTIHRTIIQYMKHCVDNTEIKNALPFYEEYNRIKKSAFSSKELKDYIHSKVNKTEIYEQFLQQMQPATVIEEPKEEQFQRTLKFYDQGQNTEANYIIEDQVEDNPLSDQEERRRGTPTIKKTKSLRALKSEEEQVKLTPVIVEEVEKLSNGDNQEKEEKDEKEEKEQKPQRIDYKGILHHLSKHKRMFLSKKTKPSNLGFIHKMVQNYNKNLQNDRIKLIQNNDGSYCLFKVSVQKITKEQSKEDIVSEEESEKGFRSHVAPTIFSEKRDFSDGDSLRINIESDEEIDENEVNSVEASSSENEMYLRSEDEEDSFELQQINEEDEFRDDDDSEIKLQIVDQKLTEL